MGVTMTTVLLVYKSTKSVSTCTLYNASFQMFTNILLVLFVYLCRAEVHIVRNEMSRNKKDIILRIFSYCSTLLQCNLSKPNSE